MCGIVGYIDQKKTYPIPIKDLKRLGYRGYDSAGIALVSDGRQLSVYKTKGKVSDLETFVTQKDIPGNIGIAYTRWTTHGEPCSINAHPHYSSSERPTLIHNGIIENYAVLKDRLQAKSYIFKSSTDTEVLIQLIEYIQATNRIDLLIVIQLALQKVIGAHTVTVLDREGPDEIIAARKSSPLVVGIGRDEFFLASDATPIVEYTDKMVYLEDGEIAVIRHGGRLKVVNLGNVGYPREVRTVALSLGQLEKGGYPHFMLKEVFEQSGCICDCMRGRINLEGTNVALSAITDYGERLPTARRSVIAAYGTLRCATLIGRHLIESFCRIPVEVGYASELRCHDPVINGSDVVIAVSQSGETADTLAAIGLAKSRSVFIYGIYNTVGSSVPRTTHTGSYIHVGPEIGVASTKTFTGQVAVLTVLALALAREKHTIDEEQHLAMVRELGQVPERMRKVLKLNDSIVKLSKIFTYVHNFIYLGCGYSYPVALEGVLKSKEISYIHAEGYPAAEMKHGPIALIDAEIPVVVIATQDGLYEKMSSNIQEIKARKGRVIAIIIKGNEVIGEIADTCIGFPGTIECLDPLITAVPLQLLAYHIAVYKGMDVDRPRNLAKPIVVEWG